MTHAQGGEGDLTVTIPFYLDVSQGVSGANWTYSNSTFTITHSGDYVVTGTTTTNRVAVAQGVTANITTNNVSIDVSDVSNAVAFDIAAGARVELVLAGINTLKSNVSAGLHVPQGAELTITAVTSADSLLAVGGHSTIGGGAGIGGNSGENAGTITIHSGRIGAKGGDSGGNTNDHTGSAGIGGGAGSSMTAGYHSGNILIDGGTVNATGGHRGAGIGGGHFTIGGSITIGGSATVTATGGTGGSPGIGGGCQSRDGNIRITGSANVTAKGTDDGGPGIGNGGWRNYFTAGSGDNGDILIDGNSEVTATGGVYSAGIGGGTGDGGGNITIGGSATVTA